MFYSYDTYTRVGKMSHSTEIDIYLRKGATQVHGDYGINRKS